MISFTGSSNVGRRIGELAGKHLKKVQLELGGKNAVIVLEDADIDAAASAVAFGAWFHQGQICMTTSRILAQNKIVAALTEKLVATNPWPGITAKPIMSIPLVNVSAGW